MAQVEMEFKRGMAVVYNLLKSGKSHSLGTLRAAMKKEGIKKAVLGRIRRLGRIGRSEKLFDVVINYNADDREKSTVQLVKGSQAKKSIAEKSERYANLVGGKKTKKSKTKKTASKKAAPKVAAKKTSKSKSHAHKSAKKASAKKVAVTAGGSEESSDNEVLES